MRREILEAVFPKRKGKYEESEFPQGWYCAFVNGSDVYQAIVIDGKFSAQTLIDGVYDKNIPIPLKAIVLLAKYIEDERS